MALLNTLHGVSRPDSRVLVAFENHNPTATKLFLAHLPRYFDTVTVTRPLSAANVVIWLTRTRTHAHTHTHTRAHAHAHGSQLRQFHKLRLFELKRKDDIEAVEGDAFQNFLHDYSDDTDSDYDSD